MSVQLEDASVPIPAACQVGPAESGTISLSAKLAALTELTKPRIAVMVLLTVAIGFLLGSRGTSSPLTFLLAVVGTSLVAGGASVWNQILERDRDALMKRTSRRPLPTGRVSPLEAAVFASVLAMVGLGMLLVGPHPIAAGFAAATLILYVVVYTPLKPVTTLNTAIGAIPGALPPLIGWTAATGEAPIEAWTLFLIMFLWQFPHFLSIAWLYREDYALGGFRMLPIVDPSGRITGRQAAWYALILLPASLLPAFNGLGGPWFIAGAILLGLHYLWAAVRFWREVNDVNARRLMKASFLYLPLVLLLLVLNPLSA